MKHLLIIIITLFTLSFTSCEKQELLPSLNHPSVLINTDWESNPDMHYRMYEYFLLDLNFYDSTIRIHYLDPYMNSHIIIYDSWNLIVTETDKLDKSLFPLTYYINKQINILYAYIDDVEYTFILDYGQTNLDNLTIYRHSKNIPWTVGYFHANY